MSTDALGTTDSSQVSTITSYDTILMETRKNAGMYTLVRMGSLFLYRRWMYIISLVLTLTYISV